MMQRRKGMPQAWRLLSCGHLTRLSVSAQRKGRSLHRFHRATSPRSAGAREFAGTEATYPSWKGGYMARIRAAALVAVALCAVAAAPAQAAPQPAANGSGDVGTFQDFN